MGHAVFISHANADRKAAEAVCTVLERNQTKCFMAERDIHAGINYATALREAVVRSDLLLLVFSERSNASPHVQREVEQAWRCERPILVSCIDEAALASWLQSYPIHTERPDAIRLPWEERLPGLPARIEEIVAAAGRGPDHDAAVVMRARQIAHAVDAGLLRMIGKWFAVLLYVTIGDSVINLLLEGEGAYRMATGISLLDMDYTDRAYAVLLAQSFLVFPLGAIFFLWICGVALVFRESGVLHTRLGAAEMAKRIMTPLYNFVAARSVMADLADAARALGSRRNLLPMFTWWWPLTVMAAPLPWAGVIFLSSDLEVPGVAFYWGGLLTTIAFLAAGFGGLRFRVVVNEALDTPARAAAPGGR